MSCFSWVSAATLMVRLPLTAVFSVGHMVSPVRIALGDREVKS